MKDIVGYLGQGVMFGKVVGFDAGGLPMVSTDGLEAHPARSLVLIDEAMLGREVAVVPVASEPSMLLILGIPDEPMPKRKTVEAERELVLRCGKSSVTLNADGRVTIRGTQLLSRAEGQNRVQGAAVMLN